MHTILTILLQAGDAVPAQPEATPYAGVMQFLPIILMVVVFYFLLIRPQAKRQKAQQNMLSDLKQGDDIVTIGGIHAKIAGVRDQDKTLIVKTGDNNKITIDRAAVARVVGKSDGSDKTK